MERHGAGARAPAPGYIPSSGRGSCGRLALRIRVGLARPGGRLRLRARHAETARLDPFDDLRDRAREHLAVALFAEREGEGAQVEHLLLAADDAFQEAVDSPLERLRRRLTLHRGDPAQAERAGDVRELHADLARERVALGRGDREPLAPGIVEE